MGWQPPGRWSQQAWVSTPLKSSAQQLGIVKGKETVGTARVASALTMPPAPDYGQTSGGAL